MRSFVFGLVPLTLTLLALAAPQVGRAAPCEAAYSSDQLVLDVSKLESAVQDQDEKAAIATTTSISNELGCSQAKLPLAFLARVYRGIAGGYYVGGDRKKAEAWFRTAIEIDRTFRYALEDLPADHPLRTVYASMLQAEPTAVTKVDGKTFGPDGDYFLDGRRIDGPAARTGQPHVLQREHAGGIETWLIEGNGFPAAILVDGRNSASLDKDAKKKGKDKVRHEAVVQEMGQGAVVVERSRPPEQIPLLVGGSGLVVAGLGLTVGSLVSRDNFRGITDSEADLRSAQQTTNRLALGAVAAAALGAGTLTYGIIIDDGGSPIGTLLRAPGLR